LFTEIGALAVYVTDKELAKEFYTDVLGFEIAFDVNENLCFLQTKNGKVYIYLEGGKEPVKIDDETCRLSFFLTTEKPIKVTFAELKKTGVNILDKEPVQVDDEKACFRFTDPDGNIIEACGKM